MPSKSIMTSFSFALFLCWYDKILIKATQEKKSWFQLTLQENSLSWNINQDRISKQMTTSQLLSWGKDSWFLLLCYTKVKSLSFSSILPLCYFKEHVPVIFLAANLYLSSSFPKTPCKIIYLESHLNNQTQIILYSSIKDSIIDDMKGIIPC